ncbi:DUF6787 family protein [Oceanihabitans sp. IOP_32]|uniref:DUF6787 family protein n=1 Tax=Oceanihabitans sp. IOP_32 TaxID=2529032 RepID=UPI001D1780B6|nr:DUF6787 family protein [Oceanihabitans sp. IOP_32]
MVKKFKDYWEIKHNWQLFLPFLGVIALGYSSYIIGHLFLKEAKGIVITSIIVFFILLKVILFIFGKLENKWKVKYKWEMISIFLVFALTGSSSLFISRPLISFIGITKENFPIFMYWILFILVGFIFYQILLLAIGWLFGQSKFFLAFEKKMLNRIGLKRFLD